MGEGNKSGWREGTKYTIGCVIDDKGCGFCGVTCYGGPFIPPKTVRELTGKEADSIMFMVNFLKDDKALYEQIKTGLSQYENDETEVWCTGNGIVRKKLDIMDQHKDEVEDIKKYNENIKQLYTTRLKELELYLEAHFGELGCNLDECDIGKPKLRSIPDEWYHYAEFLDYTNLCIIVCARNGSLFHNELQKLV